MTGNDLIGSLTSKTSPPYPVFIFRDENRQILGEYDPHPVATAGLVAIATTCWIERFYHGT